MQSADKNVDVNRPQPNKTVKSNFISLSLLLIFQIVPDLNISIHKKIWQPLNFTSGIQNVFQRETMFFFQFHR